MFQCPLFWYDTQIPKGGSDEFRCNSFKGNLQNAITQQPSTNEACELCVENKKEAKFRCLKCCQGMCELCCKMHNKLLKDHVVNPISADMSKNELVEICYTHEEMCSKHPDDLMDKAELISQFSVPFRPYGMTVNDDGEIVVGIVKSSKIHIISTSGEIRKTFKTKGVAYDIAVIPGNSGAQSQLIVSEIKLGWDKQVNIYSNEGIFSHTFLEVDEPYGVAVCRDGEVVVTSSRNKVSVYSKDGQYLRSATVRGARYVAILPSTDDIIVTYRDGVMSLDKQCQQKWCYKKDTHGFSRLRGVCAIYDFIFVTNFVKSKPCLIVLDRDGYYINTIVTIQAGSGKLDCVSITREGLVVVTDDYQKTVSTYKCFNYK